MEKNYNLKIKEFLAQPEATFYHITTLERWVKIKNEGLMHKEGHFVSRSGEFPILASIAIEQLEEVHETMGIVFLKLPQAKNNFLSIAVLPDTRAQVEWTQPFQNFLKVPHIESSRIELMMILMTDNPGKRERVLDLLTTAQMEGIRNYKEHFITERWLKN